jgi:chromosome transmission fidelity protein 1
LRNWKDELTQICHLHSHVVIIDEAHNLISTLLSLHSITLSISTIDSLITALQTYWNKFKSRLTGLNASYLKQLTRVLLALKKAAMIWVEEANEKEKGKARESMMTVNELMKRLAGTIDQVNFLKLDEYLSKSKIARKVSPSI